MAHWASMLRATTLRNHDAPSIKVPHIAVLALALLPAIGHARTLDMRVDSLRSAVAIANGLHARLDWPDTAPTGALRIDADAIDASAYGYRFSNVHWECPLTRDGNGGWHCDGDARAGDGKPVRQEGERTQRDEKVTPLQMLVVGHGLACTCCIERH